MTLREVLLSIRGLREQNEITDGLYRRMTFIIALSGFNGDGVRKKFNKLWPTERKPGDLDFVEKAKGTIKKLRERQAMQKAKDKLNAGRS